MISTPSTTLFLTTLAFSAASSSLASSSSHSELELRDAPEAYGRRNILRNAAPLKSRRQASVEEYPRAVEEDDMYARAFVDGYSDAVYVRGLDDDDLDLYARIGEAEELRDMETRYFDDEDLYGWSEDDEDEETDDEPKTRYFDAEDLYERGEDEEELNGRDLEDEGLYERGEDDELALRDDLDARMDEIDDLLARMTERNLAGELGHMGQRPEVPRLHSVGSRHRSSRFKSPLLIKLRDSLEQQVLSRNIEFGDELFF